MEDGLPKLGGRQTLRSKRVMDYHDLKMLELEQAAEEHLKNALAALERGEVTAQNEMQQWTITRDNIRRMRASVPRVSASSFSG